jgi:hypothetical protein
VNSDVEGLRAFIDRELPIQYSMSFEHLTGCGDDRGLPVEECPRYAQHRAEGEAFADALQLREARQRVAQALAEYVAAAEMWKGLTL